MLHAYVKSIWKQDFTEEEEYQQKAIWELLYTEYTYLTQLAVVINVSDVMNSWYELFHSLLCRHSWNVWSTCSLLTCLLRYGYYGDTL